MKSNPSCGHTLMELIIAISVTSILAPLVFSAYLTVYKEFKLHTRRAQNVFETVVRKGEIDRTVKEINSIGATYKHSFEFRRGGEEETHRLSVKNNSLYINAEKRVSDIATFSYTLSDRKTANNKSLMLWEAELTNGFWVGGAKMVFLY